MMGALFTYLMEQFILQHTVIVLFNVRCNLNLFNAGNTYINIYRTGINCNDAK